MLQLAPLYLTFQHRAGVSPYTSTFVLAQTCVFDKQSLGLFCCGLRQRRQTLSRSYGRYIAEFLNEGSLDHLGLLDPSTCVGLRYGRLWLGTYMLFWSAWLTRIGLFRGLSFVFRPKTTHLDRHNQKSARTTMPRTCTQHHRRYGNINPLSIAYATRLGLGPTNPGTIIVAQETLLLRWTGFSPVLKLLIPAFSLPRAPPRLPARLHRPRNAPLPLIVINDDQFASSALYLAPLHFPRRITIDQ